MQAAPAVLREEGHCMCSASAMRGSALAEAVAQLNSPVLDLLGRMLAYNPNERISAAAALEHPYFKQARPSSPPATCCCWSAWHPCVSGVVSTQERYLALHCVNNLVPCYLQARSSILECHGVQRFSGCHKYQNTGSAVGPLLCAGAAAGQERVRAQGAPPGALPAPDQTRGGRRAAAGRAAAAQPASRRLRRQRRHIPGAVL